jgi:hypothetical protein
MVSLQQSDEAQGWQENNVQQGDTGQVEYE